MSKSIVTNIYGEIINEDDYKMVEEIFNKNNLKNDLEKCLISNKIRCACGLILSVSGLKAHVSSSAIHKKRMIAIGCADVYTHPYRPYSRVEKCIRKYHEKVILSFD
jgi:hypothetical protein